MIDLDLVFRVVNGHHGNQIMLRESNKCGLILPAFFALVFENELEYHYLYVHINSSDDQATSDTNLVGVMTSSSRVYANQRCTTSVFQLSGLFN